MQLCSRASDPGFFFFLNHQNTDFCLTPLRMPFCTDCTGSRLCRCFGKQAPPAGSRFCYGLHCFACEIPINFRTRASERSREGWGGEEGGNLCCNRSGSVVAEGSRPRSEADFWHSTLNRSRRSGSRERGRRVPLRNRRSAAAAGPWPRRAPRGASGGRGGMR